MALFLVTAPLIEPLTLTEAKLHLRVGGTDEDDYIEDLLIPAVRERAETATNRSLINTVWDLKLDEWPRGGAIVLPRPPLVTLTSVTYTDTAGASQTWASALYQVSKPVGPKAARGRVQPISSGLWPVTLWDKVDAVVVRFTAGYGTTAASVPARLRQAMLLDLGSLYEQREDLIVGTTVAKLPRASDTVYRSYRSWA